MVLNHPDSHPKITDSTAALNAGFSLDPKENPGKFSIAVDGGNDCDVENRKRAFDEIFGGSGAVEGENVGGKSCGRGRLKVSKNKNKNKIIAGHYDINGVASDVNKEMVGICGNGVDGIGKPKGLLGWPKGSKNKKKWLGFVVMVLRKRTRSHPKDQHMGILGSDVVSDSQFHSDNVPITYCLNKAF